MPSQTFDQEKGSVLQKFLSPTINELTDQEKDILFNLDIAFVLQFLNNDKTAVTWKHTSKFQEALFAVHSEVEFNKRVRDAVNGLPDSHKNFLANCNVEPNRKNIFTALAFAVKAYKQRETYDSKSLLELHKYQPLFNLFITYDSSTLNSMYNQIIKQTNITPPEIQSLEKKFAIYNKILTSLEKLREQTLSEFDSLLKEICNNFQYDKNTINMKLDELLIETRKERTSLKFFEDHITSNDITNPTKVSIKNLNWKDIVTRYELTVFFANTLRTIKDEKISIFLDFFLKNGLNPNAGCIVFQLFPVYKHESVVDSDDGRLQLIYRTCDFHPFFKQILNELRQQGLFIVDPILMKQLLIKLTTILDDNDNDKEVINKRLRIVFFHLNKEERTLMLKQINTDLLASLNRPSVKIHQVNATHLTNLNIWLDHTDTQELNKLPLDGLDEKLKEGFVDELPSNFIPSPPYNPPNREANSSGSNNPKSQVPTLLKKKDDQPLPTGTQNPFHKYFFAAEITFFLLCTTCKYCYQNSTIAKISWVASCLIPLTHGAIYTIKTLEKN